MPDFTDDAAQLKVMLQKARNMLQSFYTRLGDVRRQVGDDAVFATWCWEQLGMSTMLLNEYAGVLTRVDQRSVREDIQRVRQAEREAQRSRAERERLQAVALAEAREQLRAQAAELEERRQQEQAITQRREVARARRQVQAAARERERIEYLLTHPPEDEQLAQLLAECQALDGPIEVRKAHIYRRMKERIVARPPLLTCRDEQRKPWSWAKWCRFYLKRSRREIEAIIARGEQAATRSSVAMTSEHRPSA